MPGLNPCFNGRYSQRIKKSSGRRSKKVLILVLMEDTLRAGRSFRESDIFRVLILVLMEDTLRDMGTLTINLAEIVLILVLMEDTLREF